MVSLITFGNSMTVTAHVKDEAAGGGFKFRESCFNPTPNDPNIEFDVMKNLFRKPYGALLP